MREEFWWSHITFWGKGKAFCCGLSLSWLSLFSFCIVDAMEEVELPSLQPDDSELFPSEGILAMGHGCDFKWMTKRITNVLASCIFWVVCECISTILSVNKHPWQKLRSFMYHLICKNLQPSQEGTQGATSGSSFSKIQQDPLPFDRYASHWTSKVLIKLRCQNWDIFTGLLVSLNKNLGSAIHNGPILHKAVYKMCAVLW